jgi:elongator complex protein 1
VIRVFSRDGILDSVSEPVNYLESALSWRPAGNIIASVQRREDRIDVVFFERNGLRHGEFGLRFCKDEMQTQASSVKLQWNIDSTVLAVVFNDCVQLWTMGNYHYYLKQEIPLDDQQTGPLDVKWHPENPLQLVVSGQGKQQTHVVITVSLANPQTAEIHCIDHALSILKGPTFPPYDTGLIAVIDGRK